MNYVILNTVKSTTIKGLLIQSLPPISKPKVRTKTDEIDGRDGDIVTKLGYSAYDKQMTIGLFGDFDIDEVIEYFASEGTVIFSNEPDKYYYYEIIQQIDFQRLIRFRTATVTFHVQPFKYSAVDNSFSFTKNQLKPKVDSATQSGIAMTSAGGKITLKGTATNAVAFYLPVVDMELGAGDYTITADTDGTGESSVKVRVIGENPTDADSLGGTYLQLADAGSATLSATLSASKTFKYVYIDIANGAVLDFVLDLQVLFDDLDSCDIFNRGNTISRPAFTLYGSGTVKLSINDVEVFTINLASYGYITLDGAKMNAYKGDTLMNRSVSGNFNDLKLKSGRNTISWTGDLTRIEVENVSRWI